MSVTERAARFALVSAGGSWAAANLKGLEVRPDGRVELARVPTVVPPALAHPAPVAASGLALDCRCGLYISEKESRRVVRVALDCGERAVLPISGSAPLSSPAGLCVDRSGRLFVADPGRGEVLVFSTQPFALLDTWSDGLVSPVAVAPIVLSPPGGTSAGGHDGLYVLDDDGDGRVLRLDRHGRQVASITGPARPIAIASASDGTLYVGDRASRSVLPFDPSGASSGDPLAAGATPQALAVAGDRLYVADETSGEIRILARHDGLDLGVVAGFLGPVSSLAVDRDGRLYVTTGADGSYLVADPAAGRQSLGVLHAGPLDAGEENLWSRVAVDAETPPGSHVLVDTFTGPDPTSVPVWVPGPTHDLLVDGERFLWLRLTLEREQRLTASTVSPLLVEARAETEGESYLDYLPLVYSRADGGGFLHRLLALAQSELGDHEAAIELLARRFNVATAPAQTLGWLAGWQAFEPPPALLRHSDSGELRALMGQLPELYRQRGTPEGVARMVEVYTGVRPVLHESLNHRAGWILDAVGALGFDTVLTQSAPEGIILGASVVGASAPEEPGDWGRTIFGDTAHRFTAVVPAGSLTERERQRVGQVLEAEKPAHAQCHLCFAEPRFRVGVQATVGLDTIVAGPSPGFALGEQGSTGGARLGLETRTADGQHWERNR